MTPPWAVMSPMRTAPVLWVSTVMLALMIESGGPTQTHMSPMCDAGRLPISTVGTQGPEIGPPTWGTGPVNIGQVCMSVIRDAGWPIETLPSR